MALSCSLDGVPFLMHDTTLRRTTNVEQLFPELARRPAAMVNWTVLQRLNAGQWFLKVCLHLGLPLAWETWKAPKEGGRWPLVQMTLASLASLSVLLYPDPLVVIASFGPLGHPSQGCSSRLYGLVEALAVGQRMYLSW